jgi:predicted cobalt transporter CbtA
MVGKFLLRGMLAGVVAGLLTFGFARWCGEPQVEQAVSLEGHAAGHAAEHAAKHAADHSHPHEEEELVSRTTQAGIGLLTGVVVFGAAVGGLFSLVFAYAYGRVGKLSPRALSAWLALAAFTALAVVPALKYPANPPSVGFAETIGYRTGLFFLLIAMSIIATVFSLKIRGAMAARLGPWNASISAAGIYIAIIVVVLNILPPLNEVSADFPATLLWQFRIAAIGMQFLMWATIGLLFGWLVERSQRSGGRAI